MIYFYINFSILDFLIYGLIFKGIFWCVFQTRIGLLLPDSAVVFEKAKDSAVNLVGQSKG